MNVVGNRLIQRLHQYDAIVKNSLAQQEILTNKLKEVAPHLFTKQNENKVSSEQAPPKNKVMQKKRKPKSTKG